MQSINRRHDSAQSAREELLRAPSPAAYIQAGRGTKREEPRIRVRVRIAEITAAASYGGERKESVHV